MFGLKRQSAQPSEGKANVLRDLLALHNHGSATWSSKDTRSLAAHGFASNPVVYRCIQMVAEAAASVPLRVTCGGEVDEMSGLRQLLQAPNPDQSGSAFFEALYGYLLVAGNAYIDVVQGIDGPVALYLLRPDLMKIERNRQGWPVAYIYGTGREARRIVRGEDGGFPLVHLRLFNPLDAENGQSPLAVASRAIDVHNAALGWNKALLDNAARPSGALVYRGVEGAANLTGEQFDRLKAELSDTYQGARNAGRPLLLDGGLDWKPMSLTPAEMDFQELKNSAAREIALAFGVPPMLLGIPGDNSYANYQQATLSLWRQTVLPLVEKVVSALGNDLCQEEMALTYDADSIDALHESRLDRLRLLLSADVLTDAEKRRALGYRSVPGEETGDA